MLSELANVVTAISAAGAAFFAWQALQTWKVETRGRRRSDLAASVLSDFYKIRAIIIEMRNPFYRAEEFADMPSDAPRNATASHVISRRVDLHSAFLDAFQSRRFEFAAVFGREHEHVYQDVITVFNEIQSAARSLIDASDRSDFALSMRRILSGENGDPMNQRLDAIVSKVEQLCRPEIEMAAPK